MKEKIKQKKNCKLPCLDLNVHPNFLYCKKWGLIPLGHENTEHFFHLKLIVLKYFSLPFTLFEPCGAVFIMNSKIHLTKNSLNKYFKAILHYFRVYSLSGFTTAAR